MIFIVLWIIVAICLIFITRHDRYITKKCLEINQKEWDEYSKNMTYQEKLDRFNDFLYEQRAKHNWDYLYIPFIGNPEKEVDDEKH